MGRRNPNKREFVMLAHDYVEGKHSLAGMFVSEKLDGLRMLWDGGITRGMPCELIPWANTARHDRYLVKPVSTGLWTRYGQPIQAPGWWLDYLPKNILLDGEGWAGRGQWQLTSSIIKTQKEDKGWEKIKYKIFDSPSIFEVLRDGEINCPNFKKTFKGVDTWHEIPSSWKYEPTPFYKVLNRLRDATFLKANEFVSLHDQVMLPATKPLALEKMNSMLREVESLGGEGLMLRNPMSYWEPIRSHDLVKIKSQKDSEGTVVGYKWGKPSDVTRTVSGTATDKMLGKMGSLTVEFNGKIFDLSGFTDSERVISSNSPIDVEDFGRKNSGLKIDTYLFTNKSFPIGSKVTFKYRELSEDGIPKEARYWRKV